MDTFRCWFKHIIHEKKDDSRGLYAQVKHDTVQLHQHQEDEMSDEDQINQMMLERQQMLEEALDKAETGVATEEDWRLIRAECGLPN
jgi:predicted secreted protein